jgi:hypothetical protein
MWFLYFTILIYLFIYKNRKRGSKTGPLRGMSTSGRREDMKKGGWRENMVEMLCTHVCKWKNETC